MEKVYQPIFRDYDLLGNPICMAYFEPIVGKCKNDCVYCPCKGKGPLSLVDPFLDFSIEQPDFIQVAFSSEMWGPWVSDSWISKILAHCRSYDAHYRFLTKFPERFLNFLSEFPSNMSLGCTIETNRNYRLSSGPSPKERMEAMCKLPESIDRLIAISPIVNFDLDVMVRWMERIQPVYVSFMWPQYEARVPGAPEKRVKKLIRKLEDVVYMILWVDPAIFAHKFAGVG